MNSCRRIVLGFGAALLGVGCGYHGQPTVTVGQPLSPERITALGVGVSASRQDSASPARADVRDPARWVIASSYPGRDSVWVDTWTIMRTGPATYEAWLKVRHPTLQIDPISRRRFRWTMLRAELDCLRHRFDMRETYSLNDRGTQVGEVSTKQRLDPYSTDDWMPVPPESTGEQISNAVCGRAGVENLPIVTPGPE